MKRLEISIAASAMLLSAFVLYWCALPSPTHGWPQRVAGFAVSALRAGQVPWTGEQPSIESLRLDLDLLASKAAAIRIYSTEGHLSQVPRLAAAHGLQVTVGMPLGFDSLRNRAQISALRVIAKTHTNVSQVVLGNETLLESRLAIDDIQGLLDEARRELHVPVSTAEPWHIWLQHPSLADHVDFLMVHMLPYWEGVDVAHAVPWVAARMRQLRAAFPGKRIVIGEVGWPSAGRARKNARASADAQALFLDQFIAHAQAADYEYFLMEAFDQPWKWRREGEVGAHWGAFDAHRNAKIDFASGARIDNRSWWLWLSFNALFLILLNALRQDGRALARTGRAHLCVSALLATSLTVWVSSQLLREYWHTWSLLSATLLMCFLLMAVVVMLCEVHEWSEARWLPRSRWVAPRLAQAGDLPMVSVHVPICNEPVQLVLDTLHSLAAMDYGDFEVVVVDNNTRDANLWRPIQAACGALGERFRFEHRENLAGFKAGALNLALSCTNPRARVIAVIDADYQVEAAWLRDLVSYFSDPRTDIVQAPQNYRDGHCSTFKTLCADEYSGFFEIGMTVRDRRNAIIQHGTMTLVRRAALHRVGGWSEWSITEDAELGLRVLANGGLARFVPVGYGRGLTPDNFLDYKRQRFRWVLGAVHILRAHSRLLIGNRHSALSVGQRFHFLAGWLPWLADGASLVFTLLAVLLTWAMNQWPQWFELPLVSLCTVPLALFATRGCKHLHLYRTCVRLSWRRTLGAGMAGMALMPTVGFASICGVLGLQRDFLRTPKLAPQHRFVRALASVSLEICVLAGLASAIVCSLPESAFAATEIFAWRAVLVVMALPFASAVLVALLATLPAKSTAPVGPAIEAAVPMSQDGFGKRLVDGVSKICSSKGAS